MAGGQISYRQYDLANFVTSQTRSVMRVMLGQDIWPVTALNSFSQYVQASNGAHRYRLRPCPEECSSYRRRDGGSRATDDLNRSN